MRKYWFEFDLTLDQPHPVGVLAGCGVSAHDYEDSVKLLRERVFKGPLPGIRRVIEDVDVSTLDPGHVLPNVGSVTVRGIWFPQGYE